jgi:hypothetical protein
VNLEGAHSGELQYALENTTPVSASLSRLGVLITDFGLFILSNDAVIWSAMMYKMLGFFEGPCPFPDAIFCDCSRRNSDVAMSWSFCVRLL